MSCCHIATQHVIDWCGHNHKVNPDELNIPNTEGTHFTAIARYLHLVGIKFTYSVSEKYIKSHLDCQNDVQPMDGDTKIAKSFNKIFDSIKEELNLRRKLSPYDIRTKFFADYCKEHKLYTHEKVTFDKLKEHISKGKIAIASVNGTQMLDHFKGKEFKHSLLNGWTGHALVVTGMEDKYVLTAEIEPYNKIPMDVFVKIWTDRYAANSEIILVEDSKLVN